MSCSCTFLHMPQQKLATSLQRDTASFIAAKCCLHRILILLGQLPATTREMKRFTPNWVSRNNAASCPPIHQLSVGLPRIATLLTLVLLLLTIASTTTTLLASTSTVRLPPPI